VKSLSSIADAKSTPRATASSPRSTARRARSAVPPRCAGARSQGLEVRAGVHTGECELIGGKLGGIAVHIGARVAAQAAPGDIVVSQTVKDLVAARASPSPSAVRTRSKACPASGASTLSWVDRN
jgi:class 3 adenylate cyclase